MKTKFYLLLLTILLSACAAPKNFVYFSGADQLKNIAITQDYEHRIKNDDLLYITVTSSNPDLAAPFNPSSLNRNSTATQEAVEYASYLVDIQGNVVLPVLGKVNVKGLTRTELATKIEQLIVEGQYIKDPSVTVKLINFKVSVLGEVKTPGVKQVNTDRLTIFDALGLAGDLTIYGKRENVSIIREVDGVRQIAKVDLSSSDILSSQYYYLQPNDILYIQPNKKQQRNSVWDPSILSAILSGTSVLLSITSLIL